LIGAKIDRKTLARAVEKGSFERRARGLFALPGLQRDLLVETCKRVPGGTICLLSALYFHGLISEEPPDVWVAIDHKARLPRIGRSPLKFVRFSGEAMTQGVVNLKVGGVPVRVYSPMKTIADCFKFRRRIGLKVGPAALQAAIQQGTYSRYRLLHFARICRVERLVARLIL
jgi:predicted transcriptional regulator of viral defense system